MVIGIFWGQQEVVSIMYLSVVSQLRHLQNSDEDEILCDSALSLLRIIIIKSQSLSVSPHLGVMYLVIL